MKCPILSAPTARTAFTEHFADVDCLQEECAWWSKKYGRCAILAAQEAAGRLEATLEEMKTKMPHVGQFTK